MDIADFNRFYQEQLTRWQPQLPADLTRAELAVMMELGLQGGQSAGALAQATGLDGGYLSRLLQRLQARGWLQRREDPLDRRRCQLQLTPQGQELLGQQQMAQQAHWQAGCAGLDPAQLQELLQAMATIRRLLEGPPNQLSLLIRPWRAGDLGWILERQARWLEGSEARVAQVLAEFARQTPSLRQQCWLAEQGPQRLGSVLLREQGPELARLDFLLVEPPARRQGLGTRLLSHCREFAQAQGYRKILLVSPAPSASRFYLHAGYRLAQQSDDGQESWVLDL